MTAGTTSSTYDVDRTAWSKPTTTTYTAAAFAHHRCTGRLSTGNVAAVTAPPAAARAEMRVVLAIVAAQPISCAIIGS